MYNQVKIFTFPSLKILLKDRMDKKRINFIKIVKSKF